jgi:glycosyltransferase involved in cell wall biosynthesis
VRAAFWTASEDGSSWYRANQPAAALGWLGHECVVDKALPPLHRRADVVVGSRVANLGPTAIWQAMAADPDGPRLVLDLDDDYFHIDPSNTRAYQFWTQPGLLDALRQNMIVADVVTVASEGLAEVVAAELDKTMPPVRVTKDGMSIRRPPIVVVPNGLHAMYLGRPRNYDPEVLTIGWAGSNATAVDYDLCARAVDKALDTFPNVRARLVGMPEELLPRRLKVEAARWVEPNETYLEAVSSFDIWVAPYRPTPFNQAKFPTKALEAGTLGIPLVASAIRPYADWITQEVDGFKVVDSAPWMWTRCLRRLIESPDLRRRIGEASRSRAAQNILQEVGRQWETVLFG